MSPYQSTLKQAKTTESPRVSPTADDSVDPETHHETLHEIGKTLANPPEPKSPLSQLLPDPEMVFTARQRLLLQCRMPDLAISTFVDEEGNTVKFVRAPYVLFTFDTIFLDRWSYEFVSERQILDQGQREEVDDEGNKQTVTYVIVARDCKITVRGANSTTIERYGSGVCEGTCINPADKARMWKMAVKGADTDAMRTAMQKFGPVFGGYLASDPQGTIPAIKMNQRERQTQPQRRSDSAIRERLREVKPALAPAKQQVNTQAQSSGQLPQATQKPVNAPAAPKQVEATGQTKNTQDSGPAEKVAEITGRYILYQDGEAKGGYEKENDYLKALAAAVADCQSMLEMDGLEAANEKNAEKLSEEGLVLLQEIYERRGFQLIECDETARRDEPEQYMIKAQAGVEADAGVDTGADAEMNDPLPELAVPEGDATAVAKALGAVNASDLKHSTQVKPKGDGAKASGQSSPAKRGLDELTSKRALKNGRIADIQGYGQTALRLIRVAGSLEELDKVEAEVRPDLERLTVNARDTLERNLKEKRRQLKGEPPADAQGEDSLEAESAPAANAAEKAATKITPKPATKPAARKGARKQPRKAAARKKTKTAKKKS